ncbi:MAG: Arm DNA-binding domain-containing protein, partial [Alphaproteobacteria bacterium]
MAKLTVKAVENASAGTARREIPDGLVAGMYLVVQPSGARSWALRYRHQGKPRKLTLGTVVDLPEDEAPKPVLGGLLNLAGARAVARLALTDVAAGLDPAEQHKAAKAKARDDEESGRDNFTTLATLFVTRHARPKNRDWKETARSLGLKPDPE